MYCENCGTQFEGDVCPNCGYKRGSKNNLIIERPKMFYGVAINIKITIDGVESYDLPHNSKLELNLTPGEHTVSYKVWSRREKTVNLNVVDNKNYYIKFKPDWLWGGFKIDKSSIID